jgi:hypothetical protein
LIKLILNLNSKTIVVDFICEIDLKISLVLPFTSLLFFLSLSWDKALSTLKRLLDFFKISVKVFDSTNNLLSSLIVLILLYLEVTLHRFKHVSELLWLEDIVKLNHLVAVVRLYYLVECLTKSVSKLLLDEITQILELNIIYRLYKLIKKRLKWNYQLKDFLTY